MVKLTFGFYHVYLITLPGLTRLGIVFLGVLCFIYGSIGYHGDFFIYHDTKPIRNMTYKGYGLGYNHEVLNQFFMTTVLICWVFSLFILIALMTIKEAIKLRTLNRFVHLGLGVFLMIAWIFGIFGMFIFRSNCCHISSNLISSGLRLEYNSNPSSGYTSRCRCLLTLKWNKDLGNCPEINEDNEYEDDSEIKIYETDKWSYKVYFTAEQILSAVPHNFHAHCLALVSVSGMVFMYFFSFVLV